MVATILPLELNAVQITRRGRRILGPVSLTIAGGGATIVLGPNGSGKTSLLRAMHGLERIGQGTVRWGRPPAEARRRQAFVFQTPIIMQRPVLDSIAYPLRLDGVARPEARARAAAAAAEVGLSDRLDQPAPLLSGGEKQKLALARALIRDPEVLFLDEPCANLDGHSTAEIEALLIRARDRGTRIVMSTHNVGQARRLASDVLFLYRGLIHESGPAGAFFERPETPEAQAYVRGDLLP
jgi:tungstate transport system ATP-binding protein